MLALESTLRRVPGMFEAGIFEGGQVRQQVGRNDEASMCAGGKNGCGRDLVLTLSHTGSLAPASDSGAVPLAARRQPGGP
jgi:hypothetical protein